MITFEQLLEDLKKQWYYIIRTDDWDRYLWEVYRNNELEFVVGSEQEAYYQLWKFASQDLFQDLPF